MKSLIRKIVRRRSKRRALRAARRNDAPVITKVIGSSTLPASLVDTAHLSILNYPADEDGMVTQVTLRLGGHAPGHGDDWEVRVYEKTATRSFVLKGKQSISVATRKTSEQTMHVHPPLPIRRGQYIGLVNKSGRLSLTYTRGWSMQRGVLGDLWDLWYLEDQPQHDIGSATPPLLMWNGRVGWFATMAQDPPEPAMVVPVCTLATDMRRILEDSSTTDVTFIVGTECEPICAHRSIIKARCDFFNALLSGGFLEEGMQRVTIPDASPITFRMMLEWLYTNDIENLQPSEAVDLMQLASKYCIASLLAKCELIIKPYVDYDNVSTLFMIGTQCSAAQLLTYCDYYARKYQVKLISTVNSSNAEQLHLLATKARLQELSAACEPYLSAFGSKNESDGEAKQQSDESKEGDFNYARGGAHPPATPPPNFNGKPLAQRERMWSA